MKYFWTEAERKQRHTSCCFEFQMGEFSGSHWKDNSLCLNADLFDALYLFELFSKTLKNFDYYGLTRVTVDDWNNLFRQAQKEGGDKASLISELSSWAAECFRAEKVFYILGI